MVRRTVTILEQKNGGVDPLPLNATAIRVLSERHNSGMVPGDNVFSSKNGTRIIDRNLFRAFESATERAKVRNFRFHDLRHTFATRLVQAGVGIYEVQRLGRWRNVSNGHEICPPSYGKSSIVDRGHGPFSEGFYHNHKKRGVTGRFYDS